MMFFAAEESFMDHLTPKALNTVLGWTIVGTSSHQLPTTAETLLVQTPTLDDDFFHQVQNWMRLDNEGVSSTKKAFSANDRRAENILQSTTTKSGLSGHRMFICPTIDGLPNASCAASNNACRKTQHPKSITRKQSMTILQRVTSYKYRQSKPPWKNGTFHIMVLSSYQR